MSCVHSYVVCMRRDKDGKCCPCRGLETKDYCIECNHYWKKKIAMISTVDDLP